MVSADSQAIWCALYKQSPGEEGWQVLGMINNYQVGAKLNKTTTFTFHVRWSIYILYIYAVIAERRGGRRRPGFWFCDVGGSSQVRGSGVGGVRGDVATGLISET